MGETGRDLLNLSDKERVAAAPFACEPKRKAVLILQSERHRETLENIPDTGGFVSSGR